MSPNREELPHATTQRHAYFWLVMTATMVMSAGASIFVTVVLTDRSERKLCAVVIAADDSYHVHPPATPTGRSQASNFAALRRSLGCPPYQETK